MGIRTSKVDATAAMFRDVLGLELLKGDPDWTILQLPTGPNDYLEIYDTGFDEERLAPSDQPLFIAFTVDNLSEAHDEIAAAGLDVGEMVWADALFGNPSNAGFGWFFFRGPDDNTYVIQQAPA